MTQQLINIGSAPEDRTGDGLRTAFGKVNANFTELYGFAQFDIRLFNVDETGIVDSTAGIQTAIDAANSAGGGIIVFPGKPFKISGDLVPRPGVLLRGVPWTYDDDTDTVTAGTRFIGDGTNDCIKWVPTTYSSQPLNGQIQLAAAWDFHVEWIAFHNFSKAINAGSLFNSGFFRSSFRHIIVTGHTSWGVYFENCSQCLWEDIQVRSMGAGAIGNMYFGASHTAYTHGNSVCDWLYATNENPLTRGIVFQTRAGASMNQVDCFHVQDSQYGTAAYSTQSATLTQSSSTVSVADGTKFAVDEPVAFSTAPSGGFGSLPYQIFFVVAKSGNDLTLSNMQRGAAITFTGTTTSAHSLVSFGFPCIEVSGLETNYDTDGTVDSSFQGITLKGVDIEGASGCQMLIQNARVDVSIDTVTNPFTGKGVSYAQNLCSRQCFGQWTSVYAMNVDIDSGTAPLFSMGGYIISWVGASPLGIWYDYSISQFVINLSNSIANAAHTFINQKDTVSGKYFTYPEVPIGQCQNYLSSTTLTLTPQYSGVMLYAGTGAATWTLPQLTSGRGGAATGNSAGMVFNIVNDSADGSAVTLNTYSAAQPFGYRTSAKTSYSIPRGGSITVAACWVAASSVFWSVLSNNGAT